MLAPIAAQIATFALQYVLFFVLQERGGPVYMSLLGAVGALVGVPVAVLLLGEAAPAGLFVGATLIAIGIAPITSLGTKFPPPLERPTQ